MNRLCLAAFTFALTTASFCFVPDRDDWVVKDHTMTLHGQQISYQSTVGTMPVRNRDGVTEGNIFFTAYTMPPKPGQKRPIMFVYNGGPGSASLWLHLGMVGPKRVAMLDDEGFMPPPPYNLVPNEETLIDTCDLVCIDPVGTGYSRPSKPELGAKFWGVQEDIDSVGRFIKGYITNTGRWTSPTFIFGESYGTFRSAGLAEWLTDNGIGLNGIIMLSTVLSFSNSNRSIGSLVPDTMFVPTFSATAWYHKKLGADLQKMTVDKVVDASRKWVYDTYLPLLAKGASMTPAEHKSVVDGLSRFTGLDKGYIEASNLRISDGQFYAQLMKDDRMTVGRLDGRFLGFNRQFTGDRVDFDASNSAIQPPFTACMNDYVRNELGYATSLDYYVLGEGIGRWNWDSGGGAGRADTSQALRSAMSQNPFIHVFFANGYYDFATPFAATEYTVNQMGLDQRLMKNISWGYYPSGHMVYLEGKSRKMFHDDIVKFVNSSLKN